MGGGQHITRPGYNISLLERCIRRMGEKYGLEIYLEPGEAVALNAGYLVTEVLDIVENSGVTNLILDSSATCHLPDVLEMPLRPPLERSALPGEKPFSYRLSACTCLAGDNFGDYSFDKPVKVGDKLRFNNLAIYSMKKIINNPANVVDEMLEGMTLAYPQYLRRLDGFNVLVRAGAPTAKVALVSGGGSGHEPSHGGFVGKGMLADALVPGINLGGFLHCLLAALIIVIFNNLLIDRNSPRAGRCR